MSIHAWGMQLAMMMTTVVGANEPLSMQVSPATSFAPANLVIRTRLEPDVNNPVWEKWRAAGIRAVTRDYSSCRTGRKLC